MAATFIFDEFVKDLPEGVHDFSTHQITVALTNIAPVPATDTVIGDITEVSYVNLSSRIVTIINSLQTAGIYQLLCDTLELLSSGGPTGPFRYIVYYNSTTNRLIAYSDYGIALTLADTESLLINPGDTAGLIRIQQV